MNDPYLGVIHYPRGWIWQFGNKENTETLNRFREPFFMPIPIKPRRGDNDKKELRNGLRINICFNIFDKPSSLFNIQNGALPDLDLESTDRAAESSTRMERGLQMKKNRSRSEVVKVPIECLYRGKVQRKGFVSKVVTLTETEARVFDVFKKLKGDKLKERMAIEHIQHLASLDCDHKNA